MNTCFHLGMRQGDIAKGPKAKKGKAREASCGGNKRSASPSKVVLAQDMATQMARLPASATAGDRQKVEHLSDEGGSSNDSLMEDQLARAKGTRNAETYRHGPSGEDDPGWTDGFSINGSEWIR